MPNLDELIKGKQAARLLGDKGKLEQLRDAPETAQALEQAIRRAQVVFLPGGFSGGDEPDGSAKFIVSFLRSPQLTDAIRQLMQDPEGARLIQKMKDSLK